MYVYLTFNDLWPIISFPYVFCVLLSQIVVLFCFFCFNFCFYYGYSFSPDCCCCCWDYFGEMIIKIILCLYAHTHTRTNTCVDTFMHSSAWWLFIITVLCCVVLCCIVLYLPFKMWPQELFSHSWLLCFYSLVCFNAIKCLYFCCYNF